METAELGGLSLEAIDGMLAFVFQIATTAFMGPSVLFRCLAGAMTCGGSIYWRSGAALGDI